MLICLHVYKEIITTKEKNNYPYDKNIYQYFLLVIVLTKHFEY